ncbi:hypothetical protein NP233_g6413 [Leucocoprinus birnbaumii]|uniref:DNA-directed RNA polymerases I, II, and III subunit RPABC3 n=1 Tax=Leucocoprinus birnbaumii TaxID=56174 RepID=A0AAD5VR20_9AGAR|nr:hypothetical protein NP233_g6413 [Leucocoprinus birnbaumii]
MANTSSNIVFDDIFTINDIDKEGKKFDRVSRLYAHSKNYDMDLTLDYNVEVFPLRSGESFALALASSLDREGAPSRLRMETKKPTRTATSGDQTVYKFDGGSAEIVTAYASFGGLLMSLTGSFRHMTSVVLGDPVYLLVRK